MSDPITVKWLTEAVREATVASKFCVSGSFPQVDPELEVNGVGPVVFPMPEAMAKKLLAAGRVAPYGKGKKTLVNRQVRDTVEIDPSKFRLGKAWNAAITALMPEVAKPLGLPEEQLEARLYKLLAYEKHGHFLPHRDSEKHDGMVASLIVTLPNPFQGGWLVVRHGEAEHRVDFYSAASGAKPTYAAFYADCEHEVRPVYEGVRVCLAYNLILNTSRATALTAGKPAAPGDELEEAIRTWVRRNPNEPLVFALSHHYTQRGLSPELLKGGDRKLAELVFGAAEKTGCLVHLAQVSRHLAQGAYAEGEDEYGNSWEYEEEDEGEEEEDDMPGSREYRIEDTFEDEWTGSEWTDVNGKKQPLGELPLDSSAVVSSVPVDKWKPTKEEYEGYTGNEGNTLDRWYHRSAIVLWHRDHHFAVMTSADVGSSIPMFSAMMAKLAKAPKKRQEADRADVLRFARAIIEQWPDRACYDDGFEPKGDSSEADFAKQLLKFHDRDLIASFLTTLAERDQSLRLGAFIVKACREHGWTAFAREMKRLVNARKERDEGAVPARDIEWVAAYSGEEADDPAKTALARELGKLVAGRFCQPRPEWKRNARSRGRNTAEASLEPLLKALLACGEDEGLPRTLDFVRANPGEFSLEHGQVPCLRSLIPWCRKRFGSVHPRVASWLTAVRETLAQATAKPPAPPADWRRPAEVDCKCTHCAQLKTFLADPAARTGRIAAREELRRHVLHRIQQDECDVTHTLDKSKSPFALLLTKTTRSHERAVKQYATDQRLLSELPADE